MRHLKKPSPAMIVACLSLFVALSGTTYAATGGNFILGQANTATTQTSLSSGVTSTPTLNVVNTGGRPAARFQANGGTTPFTVSNSTKVANLNGDLLDGLDGGSFVQGAAGRISYVRRTVADGQTVTLLTFPGFFAVSAHCNMPGSPPVSAFGIQPLHPTDPLDIGSTHQNSMAKVTGTGTTYFAVQGTQSFADTVQVGQSYRLTAGGFPRTRMVTLVLSGNRGLSGSACLFQAQAFAQGF